MKKICSIIAVAALTFSFSSVYTLAKDETSTLNDTPELKENSRSAYDTYETYSYWDLYDDDFNPILPEEDRWLYDYWVDDYIKTEPVDAEGIRVTVRVAADEEFRAKHEGYWEEYTNRLIERVDDTLYRDFKINLTIEDFVEWQSDNQSAEDLLRELDHELSDGTYDLVIGFTNDSNFNYPSGKAFYWSGESIVKHRPNTAQLWRIILHEVSHNYGLEHCHPEERGDCILNGYYYKVDTFCDYHKEVLKENINLYGTAQ
ncbi:M12 family metallo-peptidase [Longirhabdus pacifica]|uniref:M12 family metallo-peptidase n=1 Tax=Longirhabdus pacifica TaxID=2305227 RepID=UPI0013E8AC09|nr:M12 family metallo-peptidase [Longirhabdus pacifica]